ncbi:MAG: MFS transporter [Propioniciclava sp.]
MRRSSGLLTAGLLLCVLAVAFEQMAVAAAMPAAAADLGDLELYAWAFTAMMIPQVVAIAIAGRWADRHGPLRPLGWGLGLFAVGLVLAALATSMTMLLVGRAVQGLGAGGISLALMVVTGRAYDPAHRARVMTWFSACWVLPSFIGPVIAAWLSENISWHWVFWSVLPLVAIGAVCVITGLRRIDVPGTDADLDQVPVWAAVVVAVGAALFQVAGQELTGWSLPAAVLAVAALAWGIPPLMPRGFTVPGSGLSSTVITRLLIGGSFYAMLSFLPLLLVQRGLPLVQAGAVLTLSSTGWLLGSWAQARSWLMLTRDQIIVSGTLALLGGMSVIAVGSWVPSLGTWVLVAGATLTGLGMGLAMASTALVIMQLSPASDLGRNTSSLQIAEMLGNALIAGVAGTLFAALPTSDGAPLTFGSIGLLLVTTSLVSVLSALRIGSVANYSAASPKNYDDRVTGRGGADG